MGIGLVLIVRPVSGRKIISSLAKFGLKSWIIGQAVKGNKKVNII
jgi:phosphoribosylaminoimidazole (AIR) synthetase